MRTNQGALIFALLCCVLCIKLSKAQTACPIHTIPSTGIQGCLSMLGFLNATVNNRDDICSIYQESVNCMKRYTDQAGLRCTLQDVIQAQKQVNFAYTSLNLATCVVNETTGDFCKDDKRLSIYGFLSCRPYLEQMADMGEGLVCMYTKYLTECISQTVGMLGATCSVPDIERALQSRPAFVWMFMNYPVIKLGECIQSNTIALQTDQNCVDYSRLFSVPNVVTCLSSISSVNMSAQMDPMTIQAGCSTMQEIMVCMVKQAKVAGSNCTMEQMKKNIQDYLKVATYMAQDLSQFPNCPVDNSYLNTDLCSNDTRLSNFLVSSGSSVFMAVNMYNNKDLMCTTIQSSANVLLNHLTVSCSAVDIFSSLVKPNGQAVMAIKYPNIDTRYCASINGVHIPVGFGIVGR